jgi:hypothetical protein
MSASTLALSGDGATATTSGVMAGVCSDVVGASVVLDSPLLDPKIFVIMARNQS